MAPHANRPLIAVTLGDAAGVGPETLVAAWADPRLHEHSRLLAVGHPEILRRAEQLLRRVGRLSRGIEITKIDSPEEADSSPESIPCLPVGTDDVLEVAPGQVDARTGQAAYEAVTLAARLALAEQIDAMATAPLSKAALHEAGHNYPGHTELLAELCGASRFAMMLYLPPCEAVAGPAGLGVVHVTLHAALREAIDALSTERILTACQLADEVFRTLKHAPPRIGVCALNPHAGEDGLFGDEESRIIAPAVTAAEQAGIDIAGPLPADTLLLAARNGDYDAVVAMYHDQGHIALKLLGMHGAVNITLGLPIVRTSAAHGTAVDLAWQGVAACDGMSAAMAAAGQLARLRRVGV